MSPSIADFTTPDPKRPPQVIPIDRPVVEKWLGTELPADYKRLAGLDQADDPLELSGFEPWDDRAFRF